MRRDIGALAGQRFDVAVVGGGIHGAWIARRAARAGFRVALLERGDFGSGTSANSLKILHGGLRYLQHLDIARMRASTTARREHARTVPHLFEPLPCVMPLEVSGLRSPWLLGPALLANDTIAFDRNAGVTTNARLPRGRLLSAARCSDEIGQLVQRRPWAGALWWDGIARDTARLILETLHAAADEGAVIANHAQVERILHSANRVHGMAFTDRLTGKSHELIATNVVNVAGPWAGALARRSGLSEDGLPAAWTGALNVVLRRSLGNTTAVALSSPLNRGLRELFFVPWQGRTMIGTGYFAVQSVEQGSLGPPPGAIAEFITQAAAIAPAAGITAADIALVHWGLMPLEKSGDTLPRKSPLIQSGAALTGAAGLVTVIGEKLTSAPRVSARVLAHLTGQVAGKRASAQNNGAEPSPPVISDTVRNRLQARYGNRWHEVARLETLCDPHAHDALHPGSAVLQVELRHAIESEMAHGVADVLRRVGLTEAGHPGQAIVEACAAWGVRHAGWNPLAAAQETLKLDEWFRSNIAASE